MSRKWASPGGSGRWTIAPGQIVWRFTRNSLQRSTRPRIEERTIGFIPMTSKDDDLVSKAEEEEFEQLIIECGGHLGMAQDEYHRQA